LFISLSTQSGNFWIHPCVCFLSFSTEFSNRSKALRHLYTKRM